MKFFHKKEIKKFLKGRGVITSSQIISNMITIQAVRSGGLPKLKGVGI